jgi:hypothetical protein
MITWQKTPNSTFPQFETEKNKHMKILKGWKKISNQGGFLNETTGQTLVIAKAEFGLHYHVLLFEGKRMENKDGNKLSPNYPTQSKAETYAINWMTKNPQGTN